jgi:hypothetical protein
MEDNHIYNVIVSNDKDEVGEMFIVAIDVEDCIKTVSQLDAECRILAITTLEIYKEKVAEMELVKQDIVFAVRSEKYLDTYPETKIS